MLPGKWFDETQVGETFGTSVTVTETHLVLFAGLIGDFNPLHVDDAHATRSRLGGRVLHGAFTSALMSAPAGMYFHGTAIGYLEHNCRPATPCAAPGRSPSAWTSRSKTAASS
jgi:3-hydroxybutyryl-CoA dehydratase